MVLKGRDSFVEANISDWVARGGGKKYTIRIRFRRERNRYEVATASTRAASTMERALFGGRRIISKKNQERLDETTWRAAEGPMEEGATVSIGSNLKYAGKKFHVHNWSGKTVGRSRN